MDFSTRPRRRTRFADGALVAAAGVLLLSAGWSALASRAERGRVRSALAEVQTELNAAQSRLLALGVRRGGETERLASRIELTATAAPPRLLREITALLPEGVRLRSVSIDYGEVAAVALDVEARSPASWDDFLERLVRSERFEAVRPGQERREGEIRSAIHMNWRGGPS
jgi:hypothetical protein